MICVKKISMIFILFTVFLAVGIFATNSLVVYSDFAIIQSNVFQRSGDLIVIPTTNAVIENSLVVSHPLNYYTFHRAERYSFDKILKNYVGKTLQFKFKEGTLKNVRVISYDPIILKDVQTGQVYFSPDGEYLFPSISSVDSKNYFAVSTNATELSYSYITSNIGWKGIYSLDMDSSTMIGNINLWNRTDTTFRNFHLAFVAGKPNVEVQREKNYGKAIGNSLRAAPTSFTHPSQVQSLGGYKVYDFRNVDSLGANSSLFISLFSKKISLKKLNVAYNPSNDFKPVDLVAKIQHDFPIPQGVLSLYKKSQGVEYFLGQSNIPDSPASAVLEVPYGKNFDVEVKNVEMQRITISKRVELYTYETTLRNSSNEVQSVWVYEYVPAGSIVTPVGDLHFERISSNEVHFYVDVKAHSKKVFSYHVQTSY